MSPSCSTITMHERGSPAGDSLSIVIPALDEEESIRETLTRCLAARARIMEVAGLTHVEVIVVSDGSSDRTVEYPRDSSILAVAPASQGVFLACNE